jgi:ethanolamine transporter EutH
MLPAHLGVRECAMNGLYFLGHLALSTLGVAGLAAPVLTYSVVLSLHPFFPALGTRTAHWILTETPFFPVQMVVGLLWGFQLGRRYRHRVMLWTWVVPAIAIVFLILFVRLPTVVVSGVELTKAEHFFGRGCLPQNHCFEWPLTCYSTQPLRIP